MKHFDLGLPPNTLVEITDPHGTERQAGSPVKWTLFGPSTETSADAAQLVMGAHGVFEILAATPLPPAHIQTRLDDAGRVEPVQYRGRRQMGIRPVMPPVDLSWFFEAHVSNEHASSTTLVNIINGLHLLARNRDFHIIDMVLRTARLDRLAPEVIIALVRTSFPIRTKLGEWYPYIQRARKELRRRALDAQSLMSGLA